MVLASRNTCNGLIEAPSKQRSNAIWHWQSGTGHGQIHRRGHRQLSGKFPVHPGTRTRPGYRVALPRDHRMCARLLFLAPVECRSRAETSYRTALKGAAIYALELPKSIRQGPEALVKTIPTHWRLQLMDLCQYAERKLTAHSGRNWPYDSRLTITHGSVTRK